MTRPLTNQQAAVLGLLHRVDRELSVNEVADIIRSETPCGACSGSGEDGGSRCRRCFGHGLMPYHYGDAYNALQQLRKRGLVKRRCQRDEFGDELPRHVYRALPVEVDPDDPLERAFRAPSAEGV